jgi:hypothetical protein
MNFARRLQLAAAVILVALSGGAAWSQATRTITVIVPYQPGGATDVLARVLAEQIGRAQGPTMLIENRPGASTIIGTEAVSRAAPNGTTLLITDPSPDYAPHAAFLGCSALTLLHAHAVDRSGLDRCASTRCATRVGLICRDRRRVGAQRPAA